MLLTRKKKSSKKRIERSHGISAGRSVDLNCSQKEILKKEDWKRFLTNLFDNIITTKRSQKEILKKEDWKANIKYFFRKITYALFSPRKKKSSKKRIERNIWDEHWKTSPRLAKRNPQKRGLKVCTVPFSEYNYNVRILAKRNPQKRGLKVWWDKYNRPYAGVSRLAKRNPQKRGLKVVIKYKFCNWLSFILAKRNPQKRGLKDFKVQVEVGEHVVSDLAKRNPQKRGLKVNFNPNGTFISKAFLPTRKKKSSKKRIER